ncbi:hypothetical protein [Candidatus Nitrosocosmicus arcticus]|uniref:Uncharacterized protein n=1 Tax=Candidatus Nitrosocosmicus arcticus TaxID=2035267 RepID=A0A557SV00_9ARCH|nr:hypothetical protein [Candidatus Nitrosocosmicus arcticus]TVP40434.1 hypothetical protein NARC_70011 [Candidatus Nitrosocosmicus arcticus]
MKVKFSWASDDTKTDIKEFKSIEEMLDFTFNISDRIILHKLSKNREDIKYVDDKSDNIPFDFFVMIYDYNVEDHEEKNKIFLVDDIIAGLKLS